MSRFTALSRGLARLWPLCCAAALSLPVHAQEPRSGAVPEIDLRRERSEVVPLVPSGSALVAPSAQAALQARLPGARLEWHRITGSPRLVQAESGFLTGKNGSGGAVSEATARAVSAQDPARAVKTFLTEQRALFGHGPEALEAALKKQDYTDGHNGLRTFTWQQTLDGLPVFEGLLKAHVTAKGELVNIGSGWVRDPAQAADAGTPNRAALQAVPQISAAAALALASSGLGLGLEEGDVTTDAAPASAGAKRALSAAGLSDATAEMVWLPLEEGKVRLCWQLVFSHTRAGIMYLVLIDAETGELQLRRSLTSDISDATYRVFTTDSPTAFSPGHSTPSSVQPPQIARLLVTTPALNTTASPNGWIDDGVNETRGNNVDAHTDTDANNSADLPRPQGTNRVFDFPLDLTQAPSTYRDAAVTQLFYWCNFIHDRLYELGFTEAAGNFQNNNFGRGGVGNDAVQADAQDGSGTNNANFSTPPDGSPGRMQMFLWTGPNPDIDGDFDAEVVLHEYTHGLTNRLVGGGVGITATQTRGMGEGWSDFYGMTLLAEAGDDVNGVYARGGYSRTGYSAIATQNYYFGGRRYPYCTDLTKNPLTFKDIDPARASTHAGVPLSPLAGGDASEVHNVGEVWCMVLWDMRAALITRHGFAIGQPLTLQLVTDSLKLCPANPTFLEARNAILQADQVLTGGANRLTIWSAFAKRGMGSSAIGPASSTTTGVTEAYDLPDDLSVTPLTTFSATGEKGQPLSPASQTYTLRNTGAAALSWSASKTQPWLSLAVSSGTLAPGAVTTVTVTLVNTASLPAGDFSDAIVFRNVTSGATISRAVSLSVSPPRAYFFPLDTNPGWTMTGQWGFGTPTGGAGSYGYPDPRSGATGANVLGVNLSGAYSTAAAGPHYVQTPALDLTGRTSTRLQFQRWLNVESQSWSVATVEISTNGTTWTTIWTNGNSSVTDSAWTKVSYDISAWADNKPTVYLRWGHRTYSGAFSYTGWNIDDIEILATIPQELSLTLPASLPEGGAAGTGTVTLSQAASADLLVTLAANPGSRISLPASVTVPAGATSATFAISATDDLLLNGPATVVVTPSATGWTGRTSSVAITDNETAVLTLSLPASGTEGAAPVTGTVRASIAPQFDCVVQLVSAVPADVTVPASITIPAGQTSATFPITVVDDTRIDGTQTVGITASFAGWTAATASFSALDNEDRKLLLGGILVSTEGDAPVTGTVRLSGTLSADLAVSLRSSDESEATVPASVIITAGQTSATFPITIVDDTLTDGTQSALITAEADGFLSSTGLATVKDNDPHHFTFTPIGNPQTRGVAFAVSLTARDVNDAVVTSYRGTPSFTSTSGSGAAALSTSTPVAFSGGTWSGTVTVNAFATGLQLRADDGAGHFGVSNSFDVSTSTIDHFSWAPVPATVTADNPFAVTIIARDIGENTVTNFNSAASVAVATAVQGAPTGTDTYAAYQPLTSTAQCRAQLLYTAAEVGGAARLASFSMNLSSAGGTTYNNWKIRLKQVSTSTLSGWDNTGWTIVHQSSFKADRPGWVTFDFDTPFEYDGIRNLVVDLSYNGSQYVNSSTCVASYKSGRVVYGTASGSTDPTTTWSGTSPYPYSDGFVPNAIFGAERMVPIRPGSLSFSGGIASAQVSIPFAPTGKVRLVATDSAGHTGASDYFNITAPSGVPGDGSALVFADNFESGTLSSAWKITGTNNYRTQVTTANGPHAGAWHLTMDSISGAARNEATLTVNLAGRTFTILSFWVRSYNDEPNQPLTNPFVGGADFDGVAISADGITWYEVFPLRSAAVSNVWTQYVVDLNTAAATRGLVLNSSFRVRFNQYDDNPITSDGLAIDDISITSNPESSLTLLVPGKVAEKKNTAGGCTVSMPTVKSQPVVVTLASNAPAKITLPETVTIPAGHTTTSFAFTVQDDDLIDGDKSVLISASAAGLFGASAAVLIQDDDSTTVTVSAPASVNENGNAVLGTITLGAAPAGTITMALASSDLTALTVPASVTFAPGQTSATFLITPVNDARIDGTQTATITASRAGWTSGTASVNVLDDEPRTLSLITYTLDEGSASFGTVSIAGTLTTPLVVSLVSSNPARLVVPATVTIPAGSLYADFTTTAPDNSLKEGTQTVPITASAAGFSSFTANAYIYDNDADRLSFTTIPFTQNVGTSFSISIQAVDILGQRVNGFSGPVTITAAGDAGPIPVSFTPSPTFYDGSCTVSVTCNSVGRNVRITATAAGVTGTSNPFTVQIPPTLLLNPASLSVALQQGAAVSRTVTISNPGSANLTWTMSSGAVSSDAAVVSEGPVMTGGALLPKSDSALAASTAEPDAAHTFAEPPRVSEALPEALPAPALSAVLTNLNGNFNDVRLAIPGRYAFTEGVTGSSIADGGADLYDGGNYLNTNLASALPYSDGFVVAHSGLGAGGQYFTRKYDGLWVFAADINALSYFGTSGNLGADGGGSTDSAVLTATRDGVTWRGFVKRVYGTTDPSVNHLILVADNGSVTHSVGTSTDDDFHRVSGLTNVTRLYYLLFAGTSGSYINNTAMQGIMNAFLDAISGPGALSISPASGTVAPGGSQDVIVTVNAANLIQGSYDRALVFASNDAANPQKSLPVHIDVTGQGNLSVTPAGAVTSTGDRGGSFSPASQTWTLANLGTAPMPWTASKDSAWLDLSTSGGTIAPGGTATVIASLNSGTATLPVGNYSANVTFTSGLPGQSIAVRSIVLNVAAVQEIGVSPATPQLITAGYGSSSQSSYFWTLTNLGDISLNWTASESTSWLSLSSTAGTLAPGGQVVIIGTANPANLSPGDYSAPVKFTNTTTGRGTVTVEAKLTVLIGTPVMISEPTTTPGSTNTVSWNAVIGATSYEVQCATDSAFTNIVATGTTAFTTYTFSNLADSTQYYFRVRAGRPYAAQDATWTQSGAGFSSGSLTSVTASAPEGVALQGISPPFLTEDFNESGAAMTNTLFTDAPGFTRSAITVGPNTSPALPINRNTDPVLRGSGYALRQAVSANQFADGSIEAYFAALDSATLYHASLFLRCNRTANGVSGYAATILFYADGTAKVDFAREVNNIGTWLYTSSNFFNTSAQENYRMKFSTVGNVLRLNVWRVSVVNGAVVETPIQLTNTGDTLTATDSTFPAAGVPGIGGWVSGNAGIAMDDVKITPSVPTTYAGSGSVVSPLIAPAPWSRWRLLNYAKSVPSGSALTVDVLNSAGDLLAADVSSGTDLGSLPAVASQASIRLRANLSTAVTTKTPTLASWSLQYEAMAAGTVYGARSGSVGSYQFNAPPALSVISDQQIAEDSARGAISFSLSDDSTALSALALALNSSNPSLLPLSGILVTGTSSTRTLRLTPAPDQFGTSTVTLTVTDGGGKSISRSFTVLVSPRNDAPTFVTGPNITIAEQPTSGGVQSWPAWATAISPGPANESWQAVQFLVTCDHPELFAQAPAIGADGQLTFIPAAQAFGSTVVSVRARDDGGTGDGGVDTSAPQTFTITITPVNSAPAFVAGGDVTVAEDAGAQTLPGWASGISAGAANEPEQLLQFEVGTTNGTLFAVPPALAPDGTLSFKPAPDANGSATVTVRLHDSGGVDAGGVDTSAATSFVITVRAVNDPPRFIVGANKETAQSAAAQIFARWATGISAGPDDESAQAVDFQVTVDDPSLFAVAPAISPAGTLTYTPAAGASGRATVTVRLHDSGGTADSGADLSPAQTFTIAITSFAEEAGTYYGLITGVDGATPEAASMGLLRVVLRPTGALTGRVVLGGVATSFRGQVDDAGAIHFGNGDASTLKLTVARGAAPLALTLRLDVAGETGSLTGEVTRAEQPFAQLVAARAAFATPAVPTARARVMSPAHVGAYTFIAAAESTTPGAWPHGSGAGTATVTSKGAVRFAGRLPDGTAITYASELSDALSCPLYHATAKGYAFAGTVTFRDVPGVSDLDSTGLLWFRGSARSGLYPAGWAQGLPSRLLGSRFVRKPGTALLQGLFPGRADGNALTRLTEGGLAPAGREQAVSVQTSYRVVVPGENPDRLALKIDPLTGLFSGSFRHPVTGQSSSLRGALLQKQNRGAGSFRTTTETGAVLLTPR